MSLLLTRNRPTAGRVAAALMTVVALAVAVSSTPADAAEGDDGQTAGVRIVVTIPPGSLSVTAREVSEVEVFPLRATTVRVVVTDTRAGDAGFTLSVGPRDGAPTPALLTGVSVEQVPGNALDPHDVTTVPGGLVWSRHDLTVASYPADLGTGSVIVNATVVTPMLGSGAVDVVWTLL